MVCVHVHITEVSIGARVKHDIDMLVTRMHAALINLLCACITVCVCTLIHATNHHGYLYSLMEIKQYMHACMNTSFAI